MKAFEDAYLYIGIGFLAILVLTGIVVTLARFPGPSSNSPMLSLAIKTPETAYQANVSAEKLFSNEPATLLFSPDGKVGEGTIQCSINCIKTK